MLYNLDAIANSISCATTPQGIKTSEHLRDFRPLPGAHRLVFFLGLKNPRNRCDPGLCIQRFNNSGEIVGRAEEPVTSLFLVELGALRLLRYNR